MSMVIGGFPFAMGSGLRDPDRLFDIIDRLCGVKDGCNSAFETDG